MTGVLRELWRRGVLEEINDAGLFRTGLAACLQEVRSSHAC